MRLFGLWRWLWGGSEGALPDQGVPIRYAVVVPMRTQSSAVVSMRSQADGILAMRHRSSVSLTVNVE